MMCLLSGREASGKKQNRETDQRWRDEVAARGSEQGRSGGWQSSCSSRRDSTRALSLSLGTNYYYSDPTRNYGEVNST